MKKLLLLPTAFLALACTHGATQVASQPATFDDRDFTIEVGPSDRKPAAAPELLWRKSEYAVNVKASGGEASYEAVVKQVQRWEEQVPFTDTRYVTVDKWVRDVCWDWQCPDGSGQSDAWNAFYSSKKELKAKALSDAIKGVGDSTAQKLVARGYFNAKPRSWDAFKAEIRRAEQAGIIAKDAAFDVIVTYRNENLENLGYAPGSCTAYSYECDVFKRGVLEQQTFTNYRTETREQVVDTVRRQIMVRVEQPQVQNFETERINIVVGKDPTDISYSSNLTRYDIRIAPAEGNLTRVQLIGQERVRIPLPPTALVGNSGKIAKAAQNVAQFSAQVQPQYIANGSDPNDQLVLRYTVHSCKTSLFALGSCVKWTYNSPVQEVKVSGTNPTVNITMQPSHNLLEVKYTIARRNSRWYNDNFLPEQKTPQFKLK